MLITLDADDPAPPYEQIRARIAERIGRGSLAPGDRLPTVRQLAADLQVAANTVARAYRELETTGAIETRGRSGSFVTGDQVGRAAKQAAADYLERVAALGLSPVEAVALVQHAADHPVRSS